ncbi:MAG: hypothetical protein MMC23_009459 [Stictis urceolatum]|nr:hypothetical protein [Stictis urceolata]
MSSIHEALQSLGSVDFSAEVPQSLEDLSTYLQEHFAKAQLLIESVPALPDIAASNNSNNPNSGNSASTTRSRSNTASSAKDIQLSAARSSPLILSHASLQKEWGKPLKLSAKDNPLGMGVYKLSGKDGKGAWFARRSVHEGLGFDKWKAALVREFQESLEVKGAPGEGNVRGIGGEDRLERKEVEGVGSMEVYHLSAQFPGPTTPRDFVTLLLTSSDALQPDETGSIKKENGPRHYMVISKPCKHPKTEPPGNGFIRGSYESIEIIREVPIRYMKSASALDLSQIKDNEASLTQTAILKRAHEQAKTNDGLGLKGSDKSADDALDTAQAATEAIEQEARARGKTISFAGSRGTNAKGEKFDLSNGDDEGLNPVEWIMLTRSDPGGSVPRFMVERGTPSSICADAVKFLDWACQKELPLEGEYPVGRRESLLVGVNERDEQQDGSADLSEPLPEYHSDPPQAQQSGMFSNLANAAYASIETYAPKMVSDRLPGHSASASQELKQDENFAPPAHTLSDDASSIVSFASAEDHLSDSESAKSSTSTKNSTQDKQLQKLAARKAKLDAKLQKARERELKDKEFLSEKEALRIKKAEEKHAREVAKAEERHAKEIKDLQSRKERQEKREQERKEKEEKRQQEKKDKSDKDSMRMEIDALKAERDLLNESVRQLQSENTKLVAMVGKMEGGPKLVQEVKASGFDGGRSRSSSAISSGKRSV